MATAPDKGAIKAELSRGASVRSLARKYGKSEKTIRAWKKELGEGFAPPSAGEAAPEASGVPISPVTLGGTAPVNDPKPPLDARAMGELAGLLFLVVSFFPAMGPGWRLKDQEKWDLGQAIAEVAPALPPGVAEQLSEASPWARLALVIAEIFISRLTRAAAAVAVGGAQSAVAEQRRHLRTVETIPPRKQHPAPPPAQTITEAPAPGTGVVPLEQAPAERTNTGVFAV